MSRCFDAVLFDFGGVFTASPFGAFEDAAREIGADPREVLEIVFGPYDLDTDHPWHRLERGELGLAAARDEIIALANQRGVSLDPLRVLARMAGGSGAREALVARTRALRGEGYKTALVTNNAREFRSAWRPLLPLDELFDAVVDSSEVGMRKPNPAIFHHALERVGGVAAARSIFLDDHPGNIAAARRLGMQGVLVGDDPATALDELERLLSGAAAGRADRHHAVEPRERRGSGREDTQMAEVRIEQEIDASADSVWNVLGDFASVDRWFPGAAGIQVEGQGVGAVRTIPMGTSKIRERLEAYDAAGRRFEYSILEAPIPVKDYRASVHVEALGAQRCRVHWVTRFEPVGVAAEQLVPGLEGAYRSGLRAIAKLVAR